MITLPVIISQYALRLKWSSEIKPNTVNRKRSKMCCYMSLSQSAIIAGDSNYTKECINNNNEIGSEKVEEKIITYL